MWHGAAFMKQRPKTIKLAEITLSAGGATSGDTKSDPHKIVPFKEGTFFLRHTGMIGTTKTLDVGMITKNPAGDYWEELDDFTQRTGTAAGGQRKGVEACMGDTIAVSWEKGSADVVTTFTVYGVFK